MKLCASYPFNGQSRLGRGITLYKNVHDRIWGADHWILLGVRGTELLLMDSLSPLGEWGIDGEDKLQERNLKKMFVLPPLVLREVIKLSKKQKKQK